MNVCESSPRFGGRSKRFRVKGDVPKGSGFRVTSSILEILKAVYSRYLTGRVEKRKKTVRQRTSASASPGTSPWRTRRIQSTRLPRPALSRAAACGNFAPAILHSSSSPRPRWPWRTRRTNQSARGHPDCKKKSVSLVYRDVWTNSQR